MSPAKSESNYKIEKFDPPSVSDELMDKYLQFNEELLYEIRWGDTPSRELVKKSLRDPHPFQTELRWLVFADKYPEEIIGSGFVRFESPKSPSYEINAHVATARVSIVKSYRRQGIGTRVLKCLVAAARAMGKSTLQIDVSLEDGHRFCQKYNGAKAVEIYENRLTFACVDWKMAKQWISNGPEKAPGVTIEAFTDVPETDIVEFTELIAEVVNQQPFGELEGRCRITPESQRANESLFKGKGIEYINMIAREEDGAISGVTNRFYYPEEPCKIRVGVTGVRDKYRGRGLGMWLKAEMLLYLKNKYPKAEYEVTENTSLNDPMLSINESLGYKTLLSTTLYKFRLNELAEDLGIFS